MVLWTLFPCVLSWIGVTQKKWIICRGTLLQKFCCFYVSHNWLKTKVSSSFESKWILQEKAIHTWKRWLSFSSFSLFPCSPSLTKDESSLICHTNRVPAKETLVSFFSSHWFQNRFNTTGDQLREMTWQCSFNPYPCHQRIFIH